MRFQLFDRVTDFDRGRSIAGVKNVTLESGNLVSVGNRLFYPPTLAIEALAQLGGWCVSASNGFSLLVVLGMITGADIRQDIRIGDSLILKVKLLEMTSQRAVAGAEAWKEGACAIRIDKIAYGIFAITEPRFAAEQQRIFYSLQERRAD